MQKFNNLSYSVCLLMEKANMSYAEMAEHLEIKVNTKYISNVFKRYGIKHKNKHERLMATVCDSNLGVRKLAKKLNISVNTIYKIRGKLKMTEYRIDKADTTIECVISGHSGYSTVGSDIVCASISSVIQIQYNNLLELGEEPFIQIDEKTPFAYLKVDATKAGMAIMNSLEIYLNDMAKQFPNFVKKAK